MKLYFASKESLSKMPFHPPPPAPEISAALTLQHTKLKNLNIILYLLFFSNFEQLIVSYHTTKANVLETHYNCV